MTDIVNKMLGSTGGSSDNVLYGDEIMSSHDLLKIMGGDADYIFEDSMLDPVEYTNKLMTQSELLEITGGDSEKGLVEALFYQGSDMTDGEDVMDKALTLDSSITTGGEDAAYEDVMDKALTLDSSITTGGECSDIFSKKCTNAMTLRDFKACVKKTKGRKNNIVCSDDVTKALHKFSESLQL